MERLRVCVAGGSGGPMKVTRDEGWRCRQRWCGRRGKRCRCKPKLQGPARDQWSWQSASGPLDFQFECWRRRTWDGRPGRRPGECREGGRGETRGGRRLGVEGRSEERLLRNLSFTATTLFVPLSSTTNSPLLMISSFPLLARSLMGRPIRTGGKRFEIGVGDFLEQR